MTPKKKQNQNKNSENQSGVETTEDFILVKEILENTQANIKRALELLKVKNIDPAALIDSLKIAKASSAGLATDSVGSVRVIEGVFNGEKMVGPDGLEYNMPANYASKSKLVEGDILKLTISQDGSFIYKQIGPIERKQLVTTLAKDEMSGEWYAVEGNQRWHLLTAAVTYFHGEMGDEVVILIPREGKSNWAAVENIIKVSH